MIVLYAILCYHREQAVDAWPKEKDDAVMAAHGAVMQRLAVENKLGPVARLMSTTTATTLRNGRDIVVLDGPFAETKEQLLGFYVFDCAALEEVIERAKELVIEGGALEIRPIRMFEPGSGLS